MKDDIGITDELINSFTPTPIKNESEGFVLKKKNKSLNTDRPV
jgi:hypothetical protein